MSKREKKQHKMNNVVLFVTLLLLRVPAGNVTFEYTLTSSGGAEYHETAEMISPSKGYCFLTGPHSSGQGSGGGYEQCHIEEGKR